MRSALRRSTAPIPIRTLRRSRAPQHCAREHGIMQVRVPQSKAHGWGMLPSISDYLRLSQGQSFIGSGGELQVTTFTRRLLL